jgi:DNA repair exonuclease SbcCD ATPase subunit
LEAFQKQLEPSPVQARLLCQQIAADFSKTFDQETLQSLAFETPSSLFPRSAYFQQIAADVKQHAAAIQQAKAAIETFQTSDMAQLLSFRTNVETVFETLTDESQVLARFEGFPSRKLETIRMAASLHSRLAGMRRDLEQWKVTGGAYEELERAIKYFDKVGSQGGKRL